MEDSSSEEHEFTELSDEEIQELSREIVEDIPEAIGNIIGFDVSGHIEDSNREELREYTSQMIDGFRIGIREVQSKESEEEQAVAAWELLDKITGSMFESGESEESITGIDTLIEKLRATLKKNRAYMAELGYTEYYDLLDEFALDIVESGLANKVKGFFDGLEGSSQQTLSQRVISPVISEYYVYFDEHREITDAEEVRKYADIYYELAELVGKILPQFIAVLQVVSGREETYDELNEKGLNDLLQKLGSKKYSRFNKLTEAIDREIRNSIGHRDFRINPTKRKLVFNDCGKFVAEHTYSEFQVEVIRLSTLFNALIVFRLMITYYHLHYLSEAIDDLREEIRG